MQKSRGLLRLRNLAVGVATAIVLTLALPVGASAATQDDQGSLSEVVLSAQQLLDVEQTAAASNSITKVFNASAAADAGASEQGIADFASVLIASGWDVEGEVGEASSAALESAAALAACNGYSGYHGFYPPWGQQFGLNSCQTEQIIAAAAMGTAGAGIITGILTVIGVTAIVGGIAAIVTGVIGFGAGALAWCQSTSSYRAIWLNVAGTPIVSCWAQ
jgi:hypothetical protein